MGDTNHQHLLHQLQEVAHRTTAAALANGELGRSMKMELVRLLDMALPLAEEGPLALEGTLLKRNDRRETNFSGYVSELGTYFTRKANPLLRSD